LFTDNLGDITGMTASKMTPRARMLAAYRHEKLDRVPIFVRGVHVLDEEWVAARDESWRPLIDLVAAQCEPITGYNANPGWMLSAYDALNSEHERREAGGWYYDTTIVHTPKGPLSYTDRVSTQEYSSLTDKFWIVDDDVDLERFMSVPYEPPQNDLSNFQAFDHEIGERGVVFINSSDPIAYVHSLLGSEKLAMWTIERQDDIDILVDLFTQRLLTWIDYLLTNNIHAVYGFSGAEYCLPPLMPPSTFRRWVTEPMKRITERIHRAGQIVHVHSHGPIDIILEQFAEMGADVLHPIEPPPMGDVTLAEAKHRIGDQVCLEGNIQVGDLFSASVDEVREVTKRAMDEGMPGGGFVLCPTASPYTPHIEPHVLRNYVTMIETAIEMREY
jgi:hypothetical protein